MQKLLLLISFLFFSLIKIVYSQPDATYVINGVSDGDTICMRSLEVYPIFYSPDCFFGVATYYYNWDDGTKDTIIIFPCDSIPYNPFPGTGRHTYTMDGTYTISLTISDTNGLSALFTNIITIIDNAPQVSFDAPDSVCLGSPVIFTNTTPSPTFFSNIIWDFGYPDQTNKLNPDPYYFVKRGNYPVSLFMSKPKCFKIFHDTITIYADTSLGKFTWNTSCPCNSVEFTSLGSGTVLWHFGDGDTSTEKNTEHLYAQPGEYLVSLTEYSLDGSCYYTQIQKINICGYQNSQNTKSNNNWFFGNNAGINFDGDTAIAITGGQTNQWEGTASISDIETGDLLFYTNGITVWDNTHDTMPNGTGLNGHNSASQSALIVPVPGKEKQYYIFTTNGTSDFSYDALGYYYSIVDLDSNGGNGDIILKNVPLFTGPCVDADTGFVSHEAISATVKKNATCNSNAEYWVMIPTCLDTFSAYLITDQGILPAIKSIFNDNLFNKLGYSAFSPNGYHYAVVEQFNVRLFDFNKETGKLSNRRFLYKSHDRTYMAVAHPTYYSISFSPDNSILYVSHCCIQRRIDQFDLTSSESNPYSVQMINSGLGSIGGLAIGPNEKIYIARENIGIVSVIDNPNILGSGCNFIDSGVVLIGGASVWSRLGLQNIVPLKPEDPIDTLDIDFLVSAICNEISLTNDSVDCDFIPDSTETIWNFGDGNSVTYNTLTYPSHIYTNQGIYTIELMVNLDCYLGDTVSKLIEIDSALQVSFSYNEVCAGEEVNFISITNDSNGIQYHWSDPINDINSNTTYIFQESGNYIIQLIISNTAGCSGFYSDTIYICEQSNLFLPNALSPNNDNKNDYLDLSSYDLTSFILFIYDRRGNLVHQGNEGNPIWDANSISSGIYCYYFSGINNAGTKYELKGNIEILH